MPHFGEVQSLVGTLRSNGAVSRYYNSLTTPAAVANALLMETTDFLLMETGDNILLDP